VKIVAKSISLAPRTKPKKQDKYDETSKVKREYKFEVSDKHLVYNGILDEYKGKTCVVVKRSRRHINEYYRVKFEDGEETDTSVNFLMGVEEYEQWLLDQDSESNGDDLNDVSEIEMKIIESGLIPMKNEKSCHNQILFYQHSCDKCDKESTCIYWKKYKYDKVKF
jgi:hypothetical protein